MSSVPDLDLARIRQFCEARVPAHIRGQARVEADVRGRSVTILDCHPPWQVGLTEWFRLPVAQLRYDPDGQVWTVYWADRNTRWHPYPDLGPGTIDLLLREIDEDPLCIVWG